MADTQAYFNELVEKRFARMKALKPGLTDEEIRAVAVETINAKLAMNLLSDKEQFEVEMMLLQATLEYQLHRHQLGDFFIPGKWFFDLNSDKQKQITSYAATRPFEVKRHRARLIWCGPSKMAFRFEE